MATRYITRAAGTGGMAPALPDAIPFQYDSDDDLVKFKDDGGTVRSLVSADQTQTLTNKSLTTPTIDGVLYSAANDRQIIVEAIPVSGTTIHAAVTPLWVAPAAAIILRAILHITTVSTGASTLDIGYTATSGTTSSDSLLDGVSGASLAIFDSQDPALDSGANAKAQLAAAAKWITAAEASGDTTALVGVLYVFYMTQS